MREFYFSFSFGMRQLLGCDSNSSSGSFLHFPTHTKCPASISCRSFSDFSVLWHCHWQCSKLRAIRVSIRSLCISCSSNSSVWQKRKFNNLPSKTLLMIFEDREGKNQISRCKKSKQIGNAKYLLFCLISLYSCVLPSFVFGN